MYQMTHFDGERIMIQVMLIFARKDLVQGDRVVKWDVTVRQMTPRFFRLTQKKLPPDFGRKSKPKVHVSELT